MSYPTVSTSWFVTRPFSTRSRAIRSAISCTTQPCFVRWIGTCQNLTGADAAGFRFISLNVGNPTGLAAPGVIDEKFGIDSEQPVQKLLIIVVPRSAKRTSCNITHGENPVLLKLFRIAPSHAPEICKRPVAPQLQPVFPLIQKSNADAVLICGNVLGHNVHGNLGKVKIGADSGCGCVPVVCSTSRIISRANSQAVLPEEGR